LEGTAHYGFIFFSNENFSSLPVLWARVLKFVFESEYMFSIKMVTFCKSANCPSSQKLLSLQKGDVSDKEAQRIRRHLTNCEFCLSEIEFYSHYPQSDEGIAEVEIPLPLYELAEALLSNKHKDFSLLNKLLNENDGLVLEKA
jgi:hypothetical protein